MQNNNNDKGKATPRWHSVENSPLNSANPNPKYQVILECHTASVISVQLQASSPEEAKELARDEIMCPVVHMETNSGAEVTIEGISRLIRLPNILVVRPANPGCSCDLRGAKFWRELGPNPSDITPVIKDQ